ncbi:hypothetical protein ACFW2D_16325 [Streptomyces sp. NPDC058914]|uniref:hypothetical protein n=1 Tax=Streptomyces sp. NPDC058914 TaxID=3346671 RepID=UPI0036A776B9
MAEAVPDSFLDVVGSDQRNCPVVVSYPADDGTEHVSKLRGDDQQPFRVCLRRDDVQQGNQFASGRKGVLDEAVMAEFGQLLDPDAGVPEDFDGGPGRESVMLFESEVASIAGVGILDTEFVEALRERARGCVPSPGRADARSSAWSAIAGTAG